MCWCEETTVANLYSNIYPELSSSDENIQKMKCLWDYISSEEHIRSMTHIALKHGIFTPVKKNGRPLRDIKKKIDDFYSSMNNKNTMRVKLFDGKIRLIYGTRRNGHKEPNDIAKIFAREHIKNGRQYDFVKDKLNILYQLQHDYRFTPMFYDISKLEDEINNFRTKFKDENISGYISTVDKFLVGDGVKNSSYFAKRKHLIDEIDMDFLKTISVARQILETDNLTIDDSQDNSSIEVDNIQFLRSNIIFIKAKIDNTGLADFKKNYDHVCSPCGWGSNKYLIWFQDHIYRRLKNKEHGKSDTTCSQCCRNYLSYTSSILDVLNKMIKLDKKYRYKTILERCTQYSRHYDGSIKTPSIENYLAYAKLSCAALTTSSDESPYGSSTGTTDVSLTRQTIRNIFNVHQDSCTGRSTMIKPNAELGPFNVSFANYLARTMVGSDIPDKKHGKYWKYPSMGLMNQSVVCLGCRYPKRIIEYRQDDRFPNSAPPLCLRCEDVPASRGVIKIPLISANAHWSRCREICLLEFYRGNISRYLIMADLYQLFEYHNHSIEDIWQTFYDQKGLCCVTNMPLCGNISRDDGRLNTVSVELSMVYIDEKPRICFKKFESIALEGMVMRPITITGPCDFATYPVHGHYCENVSIFQDIVITPAESRAIFNFLSLDNHAYVVPKVIQATIVNITYGTKAYKTLVRGSLDKILSSNTSDVIGGVLSVFSNTTRNKKRKR